MSMAFGAAAWTITPANFNLGQISSGSSQCVGGVVGMDIGVGGTLVGDVFLMGVYSTYDFGNNRVGFAALA